MVEEEKSSLIQRQLKFFELLQFPTDHLLEREKILRRKVLDGSDFNFDILQSLFLLQLEIFCFDSTCQRHAFDFDR